MGMKQTPEGDPRIHRATSGEKQCAADPCLLGGRPIAIREVYVGVHDNAPRKDYAGRIRTDWKHSHFTVAYHIICFKHSNRVDSSSLTSWKLDDLPGYENYRLDVENELAKYENAGG